MCKTCQIFLCIATNRRLSLHLCISSSCRRQSRKCRKVELEAIGAIYYGPTFCQVSNRGVKAHSVVVVDSFVFLTTWPVHGNMRREKAPSHVSYVRCVLLMIGHGGSWSALPSSKPTWTLSSKQQANMCQHLENNFHHVTTITTASSALYARPLSSGGFFSAKSCIWAYFLYEQFHTFFISLSFIALFILRNLKNQGRWLSGLSLQLVIVLSKVYVESHGVNRLS